MRRDWTRRSFAAAGASALATPAAAEDALAGIEGRLGGRIGVSVARRGARPILTHRSGERFAMASTFKALLAAQALHAVEAGRIALEAMVPYAEADLLEHAPVTRARVREGQLSVRTLCTAIVTVSDNTAANLLLEALGGPAAFTAFMRKIGDRVTRLDRIEPMLNENAPGDVRDATSPAAMRASLEAVLLSPRVLSPDARMLLAAWMVSANTGLRRLRAGLPPGWRIGDKTGTAARGANHDVAVCWPDRGPPLTIASFIDAPDASPAAREAAHAEIGRLVGGLWGRSAVGPAEGWSE